MDGKTLQNNIVGILTTQGNVTVSQLAKRLRVRPHSVRYQLDRLVQSKVIEKSILINQRALGYQVFNLFFDLPPSRAKKALAFLTARGEVAQLTQNIGPRRYEMTVSVKDYTALSNLFQEMGDACGTTPRDVITAIEGEMFHWGLRFLTDGPASNPIVHFTTSRDILALDSLDRELINLFQSSNVADTSSISKRLRVSQSTVRYRFDKLRSSGAISEEFYFSSVPMQIFEAQTVLQLRARSHESRETILSLCQRHPHVESLLCGMGNWDYKLLLSGDSLPEILRVDKEITEELAKLVLKQSLYIRETVIDRGSGL